MVCHKTVVEGWSRPSNEPASGKRPSSTAANDPQVLRSARKRVLYVPGGAPWDLND
jgi:hypothetical protein